MFGGPGRRYNAVVVMRKISSGDRQKKGRAMEPGRQTETLEFLPACGGSGVGWPQPFSSLVQVEFGAMSHVGRVRSNNEDHFRIARDSRTMQTVISNLPPGQVPDYFEEVAYSMAVADGMGGAAAGEIASRLAITIGASLRPSDADWNQPIGEQEAKGLIGRICAHVHKIDRALAERARLDPNLNNMGTTLTFAYSVGNALFLFQVGDSRAYLYRKDHLQQLTHDHTVAQLLADQGHLRPEEVATHQDRHVLTNALGAQTDHLHVEVAQHLLLDGDRILLCTDGLTEMVPEAEIAEILRATEISEEACKALVDSALQHGGHDNVTVLIARYSIPPRVDTNATTAEQPGRPDQEAKHA